MIFTIGLALVILGAFIIRIFGHPHPSEVNNTDKAGIMVSFVGWAAIAYSLGSVLWRALP